MEVRGKRLRLSLHAFEGMSAERPRIDLQDLANVLETPDADNGREAFRWIGTRTVLVYYEEDEEEVYVRSVSATRRRLAPNL